MVQCYITCTKLVRLHHLLLYPLAKLIEIFLSPGTCITLNMSLSMNQKSYDNEKIKDTCNEATCSIVIKKPRMNRIYHAYLGSKDTNYLS